jgi:ribose transport system substrate-binding protein
MLRTFRTRSVLGIATVTAVMALAGCGTTSSGGSSSGGSPGSSPPSGSSASAGVKYAEGQLAQYEKDPAFTAPGPAFNAAKARGKSVWFIPNTSTIPFTLAVQKAFSAIAAKVGLKLTVWPSTGTQTSWVQGMDQAIAQHAGLVVLAPPPQLVGPQIAQLKAHGIPVVVPHEYDPTMTLPSNVAAFEFAPFLQAARLMADQAIAGTGGKADTLVVETNDSPPSAPMAAAITAEFKSHCPGCTETDVNVVSTDWSTKLQSQVQNSLLSNPKINYIIVIFDSATEFVTPAVAEAGKTGKIGIATFNNTPFVLTNVQKGGVSMDVGESINWIGYATMDQVLRILSGVAPLTNESAALRVFVKQNSAVLGNPADNEKGYSDDYVTGYEKLWGLG